MVYKTATRLYFSKELYLRTIDFISAHKLVFGENYGALLIPIATCAGFLAGDFGTVLRQELAVDSAETWEQIVN